MDRRGALTLGAAAALGGLAPARPDQQYFPPRPGLVPGPRAGILRATQVVISGTGPNRGLFVYNGTPALGNPPVFAVVAPGVTKDPFGNTVTAVMTAGNLAGAFTQIDSAGDIIMYNSAGVPFLRMETGRQAFFLYFPSPAAGGLSSSISPTSGTDSFGNAYQPGLSSYNGLGVMASLNNGELDFLVGASEAGPYAIVGSMHPIGGTAIELIAAAASGYGIILQPDTNQAVTIAGLFVVNLGSTFNAPVTISASVANSQLLQITNAVSDNSAQVRVTAAAQASQIFYGANVTADTSNRLNFGTDASGNPRIAFGPGNAGTDVFLVRGGANLLNLNTADLDINTIGRGLRIAEGTNARMGVSVLVAGTVTVANTSVTNNTRIFLTCNVPSGTPGFLRNSARVAGTSFTILSSNVADTSAVAWLLLEPG